MILKSLAFENFRQYKGKNRIQFSTNAEKNITIVLGENTSGKTTLLQSLYYCLYGVVNFDKKTSNDLLNAEVISKMNTGDTSSVHIEVELIHKNIEYTIKRKVDYKKMSEKIQEIMNKQTIVYKNSDGISKFIDEKDLKKTIENILPEKLAPYFFFDAERVRTIGNNESSGKIGIGNAIKGILGLEVIEKINEAFKSESARNSVIGYFNDKITVEADKNMQIFYKQSLECKELIESWKDQIDSKKIDIENYKEEVDKKSKELLVFENVKNTHEKRLRLGEKCLTKEKTLTEKLDKVKEFGEDLKNGLIVDSFRKSLNKIDLARQNNSLVGEGIPDMKATAIDEILKRGICICGEKLSEGDDHYLHLLREKEFLPPQFLGGMIREYIHIGKARDKGIEILKGKYTERVKEIRELMSEIDEIKEEIAEYDESIGKIDECEAIESALKECKSSLQKAELDVMRLEEQIKNKKNEMERIEEKIKDFELKHTKNNELRVKIEHAKELKKIFLEHYKEEESGIRRKLENRVNEYLNRLYSGHRKIEINENYNYELFTDDKNDLKLKLEPSEGLKVVTSFAFISGILSVAREEINNNKEQLISKSSEPYPLVMDATFSATDEEHVKSIANTLPEVAEQVIFVIMEKDWNHAKSQIEGRIGKEFRIKKFSESYSALEEVHIDY